MTQGIPVPAKDIEKNKKVSTTEPKIDEAIQSRKFQILFSEIKEEMLNRAEELKLNLLAEKIKKYSAKLLVSFTPVFLLFSE